MSFDNQRGLWLSLVVSFSLAFLSTIPARGVIKRATVCQAWTSRTPYGRGIYQTETDKVESDLVVEEESEFSKLHKGFLKTKKRMDMTDNSGRLGVLTDGLRYSRSPSFVDFSPVLNL